MAKQAVILAGGRGTRLRPFTVSIPKPLVPIGEVPILEIVIRQLVRHGFDRVTFAVNHLAELIQAFFGDGSKWGLRIDYSRETMPLSTMGPLKLISGLPEHFLIMNGDVLTDLDFSKFYDHHVASGGLMTVAAYERKARIDYGVLEYGPDRRLTGFKEKPAIEYHVSMGVYMASRGVLDLIPSGQKFGFDDLMIKMLANRTPAEVMPFNGVWFDIGRPDDYEEATAFFEKNKSVFLPGGDA